jgi:hypothetical protein
LQENWLPCGRVGEEDRVARLLRGVSSIIVVSTMLHKYIMIEICNAAAASCQFKEFISYFK